MHWMHWEHWYEFSEACEAGHRWTTHDQVATCLEALIRSCKIAVCPVEDEFCSIRQFDVCVACTSLSRNCDRQRNSMSEDGQSSCSSGSSSQGALARDLQKLLLQGCFTTRVLCDLIVSDCIARDCSGCHERRWFQLWRHEMCSRLCQQAGLLVAEKMLRFLILWQVPAVWQSHGRIAIAKAWIRQWNPDASQSDIQMKSLRLRKTQSLGKSRMVTVCCGGKVI